ncbi:hypothetical protein LTR40_010381, partial [Exophiala xenobiotica]
MSSISPQGPYASSQGQDTANAYKYEDPTAYQLQSAFPNQFEVALPVSRPDAEPVGQGQGQELQRSGTKSSEPKVRLRKACDSCSVRKVK